jgi:hypothetical protein
MIAGYPTFSAMGTGGSRVNGGQPGAGRGVQGAGCRGKAVGIQQRYGRSFAGRR